MNRYFYPGTNVLQNKLNIYNDAELDLGERGYAAVRMLELRANRLEGFAPTYQGLKDVHGYIFQDVYEWAGKARDEQVTIGGNSFTPEPPKQWSKVNVLGELISSYSPSPESKKLPFEIAPHLKKLDSLKDSGQLNADNFGETAGLLITTLYYRHPFREGNTRSLNTYLGQLGAHYGMKVVQKDISPEMWKKAAKASLMARMVPLMDMITSHTQPMSEQEIETWNRSSISLVGQ